MINIEIPLKDGEKRTIQTYSDIHKRDKDYDTIGNYVKTVRRIQDDLLEHTIKNNTDILISLGDVYDKGYRSVGHTYSDTIREKKMTDAVNGNHFLLTGNHLYIERDSNPEFYMLQPHERFTPKMELDLEIPDRIFQVVDTMLIGCVQISFFHYDGKNKMYIAERNPKAKYHIALYHDDVVIPASIKNRRGMTTSVNSSYLESIFANVDIAVAAHWHEALGKIMINVGGRSIPMYIPGALCHTSSAIHERHKSVGLPRFEITNNSCFISLPEFSTHLEMLKFVEKKESKVEKQIKKEFGDKKPMELLTESMVDYAGTEDILRQGRFGEKGVRLFREARRSTLDFRKSIAIYNGWEGTK